MNSTLNKFGSSMSHPSFPRLEERGFDSRKNLKVKRIIQGVSLNIPAPALQKNVPSQFSEF